MGLFSWIGNTVESAVDTVKSTVKTAVNVVVDAGKTVLTPVAGVVKAGINFGKDAWTDGLGTAFKNLGGNLTDTAKDTFDSVCETFSDFKDNAFDTLKNLGKYELNLWTFGNADKIINTVEWSAHDGDTVGATIDEKTQELFNDTFERFGGEYTPEQYAADQAAAQQIYQDAIANGSSAIDAAKAVKEFREANPYYAVQADIDQQLNNELNAELKAAAHDAYLKDGIEGVEEAINDELNKNAIMLFQVGAISQPGAVPGIDVSNSEIEEEDSKDEEEDSKDEEEKDELSKEGLSKEELTTLMAYAMLTDVSSDLNDYCNDVAGFDPKAVTGQDRKDLAESMGVDYDELQSKIAEIQAAGNVTDAATTYVSELMADDLTNKSVSDNSYTVPETVNADQQRTPVAAYLEANGYDFNLDTLEENDLANDMVNQVNTYGGIDSLLSGIESAEDPAKVIEEMAKENPAAAYIAEAYANAKDSLDAEGLTNFKDQIESDFKAIDEASAQFEKDQGLEM